MVSKLFGEKMAKLIWFVALITALGTVYLMSDFKNLEVSNEKFSDVRAKEIEQERLRAEKLAAMEAAKNQPVEEEKEFVLPLDTPELVNGHNVYFKKGKCITCHGNKGQGKKSQQAPKLAAQHDWYLYEAIWKIKNGERVVEKMLPYLRNLTDQDFKDVALYLSKLPAQ